jgi:hypothetical protein
MHRVKKSKTHCTKLFLREIVGVFFWISTIGILFYFQWQNHFGFNPCFDLILLARYFQEMD